ncbi:MAG: ATP-binding protein [Moraxella sp.]|nr:ATP-binding protein [Moraxella sp.]
MTDTTKTEVSGWKKYSTLIISLVILLVVVLASAASQVYLDTQNSKNYERYDAISNQIYYHDKFIIALQTIADPTLSESDRLTYIKYATKTFDDIDNVYQAFALGGTVTIGYPEETAITIPSAINAEDAKSTALLYEKWKEFSPRYLTLIEGLKQNQILGDELQKTIDLEVANWAKGYKFLFEIRDNLRNDENRLTGISHIISYSTIAFLIAYFAIFMLLTFRKLLVADSAAEEARKETSNIMKTVNTGLFLLDKDLTIGSQHSDALESIVGTSRLAGESLTNVLRNRISDKDLQTTEQFVEQLYNPKVKERLIKSLNPLNKVMIHDAKEDSADSRYLDFAFSRVYEGSDITRILVNVHDVSEEVKLEQRLAKERAQNDMQLEMLATILNVSPVIINDFITNTHTHIEKMNNILKNPGSSQFELESKLKAVYREMHSLKGEASALKLHSFTKIASEAEDKLQLLKNQGKLAGGDFLPLAVHLDELLNLSNTITSLGERIKSTGVEADKSPASQLLSDFRQDTDEVLSENIQLGDEPLNTTPREDAEGTLGAYLVQFGSDIAGRQGKLIEVDTSAMRGQHIPQQLSTVVRELCVQLLRNAIVHGISDSRTRMSLGKPETGKVTISVQGFAGANQDTFVFSVEDDGQGIDYDLIRMQLINSGRYSEDKVAGFNKGQLLNVLFSSGFSTKEDADEDGGRGVGLDLVKERVKEYGGRINVDSKKGEFARFVIQLPMPK